MRPPAPPRPVGDRRGVTREVVVGEPAEGALTRGRAADLRASEHAARPVAQVRAAERTAVRRRLLRRKVVGAGGTLGVLTAAGWVLLGSGALALDPAQVQLSGQGTVVDPAAVHAVIAPHAGVPLPRLDTVGLRRDLLDVPGVRAAEVTRVWPRGLEVTVVSREPVAAVQRPDGGFTLLDVEAVPVGRADLAGDLPVIAVPEGDPGGRVAIAVLAVLQGMPTELGEQVASASAQSPDTVRLVLTDGAVVEWGSADEIALKARVLEALRGAEQSRDAAVFDVSAPTMPITRS